MKIQQQQRVLIAGKTGSGKTYLARELLRGLDRLVVIDSKLSLNDWNLTFPSARDWRSFSKGDPGRFRVVAPITADQPLWYDELFSRLYAIGNLTLYIDESYAVTPPNTTPGRWLTALYTRGRELNIGVWASTQRPAWIPLFLLSEADWFFVFRLNLDEDRKRLAALAGKEVLTPIPDEHGFFMYQTMLEQAIYFSQAVVEEL